MPSTDRESRTPQEHAAASRFGAHKSWANTPDRTARTRAARSASPSSDEYWLAKQDPVKFANATAAQRLAAAQSAKRAHYAEMALKAKAAKQARRASRQAA